MSSPKKIIIKFFSDFCSSEECKKNFEYCCKAGSLPYYGKGSDKEIYITVDDDYTHAILLNKAMPKLRYDIPNQNVLGLACEPAKFLSVNNAFIQYAQTFIGKYYIGEKGTLPAPFVEHHGFQWFSYPPSPLKEKSKIMSIILSEKMSAPGHMYRHKLAKVISDYDLPIDIYGRGSHLYKKAGNKNEKIKGVFTDDKIAFEDYMFTIAIENFQCPEYFSEKIMTPLLCDCVPIYYGCLNIQNYFGDDVIEMSGKLDTDLPLLISILKEPKKFYRKSNQERIHQSINILQNIHEKKVFLIK